MVQTISVKALLGKAKIDDFASNKRFVCESARQPNHTLSNFTEDLPVGGTDAQQKRLNIVQDQNHNYILY